MNRIAPFASILLLSGIMACTHPKSKNTNENEVSIIGGASGPVTVEVPYTNGNEIPAIADRAVTLAQANRSDPDSLAAAIGLLDHALELISGSQALNERNRLLCQTIYGHKAQLLCYQGKFETALTLLEKAEEKHGSFWMNQFFHAVISDFTGDTVSAGLNYERVIDYCDYKIRKKNKNTAGYEDMLVIGITAKLLRYGIEEAREDIERLKAQKDFREGTPLYYAVIAFENFRKEEYIAGLLGHDRKGDRQTNPVQDCTPL